MLCFSWRVRAGDSGWGRQQRVGGEGAKCLYIRSSIGQHVNKGVGQTIAGVLALAPPTSFLCDMGGGGEAGLVLLSSGVLMYWLTYASLTST